MVRAVVKELAFITLTFITLTFEELTAWREETEGDFTLRLVRGRHSFFEEERAAVVGGVVADLMESGGRA